MAGGVVSAHLDHEAIARENAILLGDNPTLREYLIVQAEMWPGSDLDVMDSKTRRDITTAVKARGFVGVKQLARMLAA